MKKKIEEFLIKQLQLENLSASERSKVLKESREDVLAVLDGINQLINDETLPEIKEEIVKLCPQFVGHLTDFRRDGPQFHLRLSNGCTLAIEFENSNKPYWCLCSSSCDVDCEVTDEQSEWAKSVLDPLGLSYNSNDNFYIAWKYTNDPAKDFIKIYDSILKNTEVRPV